MPFFAVAAGPILALNLQDLLRRFDDASPRRHEQLLARLGRAAELVLLFGLLIAAWPGFLQNPPYEMRCWVVLADPSLEAGTRQLADWRKDGSLQGPENGFNFSPEAANYFAWFCPAEKGIVDSRLHLSVAEATDYVTIRRALLDGPSVKADWRRILRDRHVNHVVLYDSHAQYVQTVYGHLVRNEKEWPLLFLTGRTAVFGWVDPEKPATASLARLRLRLDLEAYHPSANKQAPAEWPGREPQPASWWNDFFAVRPSGSPDRDEAALLVLHFDKLLETGYLEHRRAWEASRIAGAVGVGGRTVGARLRQCLDLYSFEVSHLPATPETVKQASPAKTLALGLSGNYFLSQDDAPPELLLMAIRGPNAPCTPTRTTLPRT